MINNLSIFTHILDIDESHQYVYLSQKLNS
jgi:hypothetical protein